VANNLDRDFSPDGPNKAWATNITYIRTHEGWMYLTAVMELYSRQIVGWARTDELYLRSECRASRRNHSER
jgi:putative transposase